VKGSRLLKNKKNLIPLWCMICVCVIIFFLDNFFGKNLINRASTFKIEKKEVNNQCPTGV
jgi:hypothetical protein